MTDEELDQEIATLMPVADPSRQGQADYADAVAALGRALVMRYERSGARENLATAIEAFAEAFRYVPRHTPVAGKILNDLGYSLRARYDAFGKIDDLEAAIEAFERSSELIPPGDPDSLLARENLGTALHARFVIGGAIADLERSVTMLQELARALGHRGHGWARVVDNLGVSLLEAYRALGASALLDASIGALEASVADSSTGDPLRAHALSHLGAALETRSARTGALSDLERALVVLEDAVNATPPGSPQRARQRNSLAIAHRQLYLRFERRDDLLRAIAIWEELIANIRNVSLEHAYILDNAGSALLDCYGYSGRAADLDAAIERMRAATAMTPDDAPARARHWSNLAHALSVRHAHSPSYDDEQLGLQAAEIAVEAAAALLSERPRALAALACWLRARHARTGDRDDAQRATELARQSCKLGCGSTPAVVLTTATQWGAWATARSAWPEAIEAYRFGLDASERLYKLQAMRRHRASWQRAARALAVGGAYALARGGRTEDAVEVLEHHRGRRLGEALARGQAQLERLRQSHESLAEAYMAAAARVDATEAAERENRATTAAQAEAAWQALDQAVAAIRAVPSYETFMAQPAFADVVAISARQPIAYVAVTDVGGFALVVDGMTASAVWLDTITAEILQRMIGPEFLTGQPFRALAELGASVAAPLAAHLRAIAASGVVLVPVGHLGILPIHAAHYDLDGHETRLLDEFDVSYAPSALVLGAGYHALASRAGTGPCFVGIGNPLPSPMPLPYARAEVEAAAALFTTSRTLHGTAATRDAVIGELPGATHAHFACHGVYDFDDALQSRLLLGDGDSLTLMDVLDRVRSAFAAARLVVLSACQTAVVELRELPDEVTSLPSALLEARVPGVVGTLWSVDDLATALLIVRFYELLLRDAEPPARALRRAQQWLRNATVAELLERLDRLATHSDTVAARDVASSAGASARPAVTLAMLRELPPNDQPYRDRPEAWAPFALIGV